MNICLIRNAEFRTNASMQRIATALNSINHFCYIISRNRESKAKSNHSKSHDNKKEIIEINLESKYGKNLLGAFNVFFYQFNILKLLLRNRKNIDLIHVIDLDSALPVVLFAKIMKMKYVYHIADFYADSRDIKNSRVDKLLRKLEIYVINNSEITIICTEDRIEQISGSNPKRIEIVHNVPIIDSKYNQENVINGNVLKFAYVGSLHEKRFIKEMVDTFSDFLGADLHIAGMGNMEKYVKDAAKRHSNIHYYGVVKYEEAMKIYYNSNIIIGMYDPRIKNHKYAAPNKVYESMNLGRPIIYTNGIGLSELVNKHDFGWLVDYDQQSFSQLVKSIKNEEVFMKSENAKLIRESFTWDRIRENISSMYKDIETSMKLK
jgi:glycosyltransferase involved in cell wall biosynthesis